MPDTFAAGPGRFRVRALVRKYDRPGSRYTSYPSAAEFHDGVTEREVRERLRAGERAGPRDLSLYLHLPFCRSLCWYCGCTTVITRRQSDSDSYVAGLAREMTRMAALLPPAGRVVQLHAGGGTPTFLTPGEIRLLGEAVRGAFTLADDVEAGVEIDPRRLTREHVDALAAAGFNRASLGVQDHDPAVQRAVNRIQPPEVTARAAEWVRAAGFRSLNVDLIYGLPHQTVESFECTLADVLALAPDRLAVFSYAHVPWMKPAQRLLEGSALPAAGVKLDILLHTVQRLEGAGYVYVGMDHFARADDELASAQREGTLQRNFQGYSTRAGTDLYGFGMSAISHAHGAFWQNHKTLDDYGRDVAAGALPVARGYVLTADDHIRGRLIARLMCDARLDFAALGTSLGVDVREYFRTELAALAPLADDGLVDLGADGLAVTRLGRLFLRNLAMCFDPRARRADADPSRRWSRTV